MQAIQAGTAGAVQAIGEVSAVIEQISQLQVTIAAAVEEQTATTNEMSTASASRPPAPTRSPPTSQTWASNTTTEGASESRQAVEELARMSTALRGLVARFTC